MISSWDIASRCGPIWGATTSHSTRTTPWISCARTSRRGTTIGSCRPASSASASPESASAASGSCASTRRAETRIGSSDVSLASRSSTICCVRDADVSARSTTDALGAAVDLAMGLACRRLSGRLSDGGERRTRRGALRGLEPRRHRRDRCGAAGRPAADTGGASAAAADRAAAGADLSSTAEAANADDSTGFSAEGRAGGVGAENTAGRRSGSGRRCGAGWGALTDARDSPPFHTSRKGRSSTGTHTSCGSGDGGNAHAIADAPARRPGRRSARSACRAAGGLPRATARRRGSPSPIAAVGRRRPRARRRSEAAFARSTTAAAAPAGRRSCRARIPGRRRRRSSPRRPPRTAAFHDAGWPGAASSSQAIFARSGSVCLTWYRTRPSSVGSHSTVASIAPPPALFTSTSPDSYSAIRLTRDP